MTDDEKAEAQIDAALGTIEVTNSLADLAKSMRDALEEWGFSTPVAEQTGVQFMWTVMATQDGQPGGKKK